MTSHVLPAPTSSTRAPGVRCDKLAVRARKRLRDELCRLAIALGATYVDRMSRGFTATVRLDAEDAEALRKARADGFETSELIRAGLRIVAARYYPKKRKPHRGLFRSVDVKVGDESELFRDLEK